jgi:hypothetical protein
MQARCKVGVRILLIIVAASILQRLVVLEFPWTDRCQELILLEVTPILLQV